MPATDIDDEDIKLESAYDSKEVLTSGNGEIDKKMGGGIPAGSLTLVEGANNTGKSVITQQLLWGGLQQGFSFDTYTTENTIKSFVKQMDSLSLDISDYFIFGKLHVYPVQLNESMLSGGISLLDCIIADILKKNAEIILIDSLTVFVADLPEDAVLGFFATCKKICDQGKTIIITAHTFAFGEELLTRVRSLCDAHIIVKKEEMGDRLLRTMEVSKIRGAMRATGNIVAFEVEPSLGLRIIPVSKVQL